jgi:hypothetical protein
METTGSFRLSINLGRWTILLAMEVQWIQSKRKSIELSVDSVQTRARCYEGVIE